MNILEPLDVYEETQPHRAALNMAIDEALLETVSTPSLRTYSWETPSISFGYFGSFADVAERYPEREIVRRWTGGGIVPHGHDLTYSVIIPSTHPFYRRSSLDIYSAIHAAIQSALNSRGIESRLANAVEPKVSENCFANPVLADVISNGQKIAGAAHRRSRHGLLHQGSIQLPELPKRFIDDFGYALCDHFSRKSICHEVLDRAAILAESKYATEAWLKRR